MIISAAYTHVYAADIILRCGKIMEEKEGNACDRSCDPHSRHIYVKLIVKLYGNPNFLRIRL